MTSYPLTLRLRISANNKRPFGVCQKSFTLPYLDSRELKHCMGNGARCSSFEHIVSPEIWLILRFKTHIQTEVANVGIGEGKYFLEVLEQVLGLGSITRDKFFEIIEDMDRKKLSSQEFFKLLAIIERQGQTSS